jgi:CRP/FNR family cyclic AMP-dependent transcriptional regulator
MRNIRGNTLIQEGLSTCRGDVGDCNGTNKKACDLLVGTVGNAKVYNKSQIIFGQGNPADSIFYVIEGMIRLSVISKNGKEGIVGLLGAGDFFGDGSISGRALRVETATAMTYSTLLPMDKTAMTRALHRSQNLCDLFISSLVARNIQCEEDLSELLFNSSEKRLARALLLLCSVPRGMPQTIHGVSQVILAEMVGTTRSRINMFMNRFRRSGFITYDKDEIHIHKSLLSVLSTYG